MNDTTTTFDGTLNAGRKGVAYDWHRVYAATVVAQLDAELVTLDPELAE
jgi:hypothetical protein